MVHVFLANLALLHAAREALDILGDSCGTILAAEEITTTAR